MNASFAQDDWIRWGPSGQTDASDLKGSAFRFAMGLPRRLDVVARLYLVEIDAKSLPALEAREMVLNYRFR